MTAIVALPLRIGARTIWRVRRRLERVPCSLAMAIADDAPRLPPLAHDQDGYLVTSAPASSLAASMPGLRPFVRQTYRRHYATLDTDFDTYLAGFSSKSRSTLRRKLRRFAERSGGTIDCRCYRTPDEAADFHRLARDVSRLSYQERLLDAGLPDGAEAEAWLADLAARDAMRGWILFLDGRPVSYLFAPAEGDTLIYAYLGYDPAVADLSPGTVLQLEAMRMLMAERRFARFDFTEGDGQHKSQFGTGAVECIDLLLLRPTLSNLMLGHTLSAFDAGVAVAKAIIARTGLEKLARRALR